MFEDVLKVVNCAVTGSFRTNERSAVGKTFAGKNAVFPNAFKSSVLTIEVADLSSAYTHVTSRNVDVRADVTVKSCHEALAETHNFCIRFAGRIEVRAAFCAADRKTGKRVFEGLLEAEELNDSFVNVLLETKSAFVRSDCAVELASPAAVGVGVALIVSPYNSECEHSFRLSHTIEKVSLFILRMSINNR